MEGGEEGARESRTEQKRGRGAPSITSCDVAPGPKGIAVSSFGSRVSGIYTRNPKPGRFGSKGCEPSGVSGVCCAEKSEGVGGD